MNYFLRLICSILFIIPLFFVMSCKSPTDSSEYEDIEINILSTVIEQRNLIIDYESVWLKYAKINFTVKNTGSKKINGWKIYFIFHLQNDRKTTAIHKKYYTLKGGEMSEEHSITSAYLPPELGSLVGSSVSRFEVL